MRRAIPLVADAVIVYVIVARVPLIVVGGFVVLLAGVGGGGAVVAEIDEAIRVVIIVASLRPTVIELVRNIILLRW